MGWPPVDAEKAVLSRQLHLRPAEVRGALEGRGAGAALEQAEVDAALA